MVPPFLQSSRRAFHDLILTYEAFPAMARLMIGPYAFGGLILRSVGIQRHQTAGMRTEAPGKPFSKTAASHCDPALLTDEWISR